MPFRPPPGWPPPRPRSCSPSASRGGRRGTCSLSRARASNTASRHAPAATRGKAAPSPFAAPARRPGVEEPLLRQALAQVRELERRLLAEAGAGSFGRVFVQTDDETAVERAVRTFVPRLGHSEQTVVQPPRNGWIEVEDELCSR